MFLFQNKNLRIIINVKHGKLMSPERVELSTLGLQVTGAYKNQFQICCITANVYRQTTDKLMFISVISTVR